MSGTSLERRLAAVLAADVVSYSRHMSVDEEGTLATLNAHLNVHVRPCIARYRGRVVKTTGDGVLAEFGSALDATRCAIDIQEGIAKRNQAFALEERLSFRIGVNLGDVIVQDEDIFGNGVNVAARLEGLARPGGICISDDVYRQVRGKIAYAFEDLGEQVVKNIPEPVHSYRIVVDGEAADAAPVRKRQDWIRRPWVWAGIITGLLAPVLVWFVTDHIRNASSPTASNTSTAPLPLPKEPSIAVLPFDNLGTGAGQEYLGDGLAENIIASLSSLPSMFVIARSSSFSYKGRAIKVQQVARELGVRYVLEGSVQVSGKRVRVTARLVDATSGFYLWSERYDREMADIFALQDEITLSIVTAQQIKLTEGDLARTRRRGTKNLKAWLLVSECLSTYQKFTRATNIKARELAQKALALDPTYPEALIRLAHTYLTDFQTGWVVEREAALTRSIELVQRALSLDDGYPDAYVILGQIFLFLHRHDDAITYAKKAIALSPSHSLAKASLAMIQNYAGHPEEAIPLIQQAMRLSPLYPDWFLGELGRAYLLTGQYDKAIAALKRRLDRNPESGEGHILLAASYGAAGQLDKAHRALTEFLKPRPGYTLGNYADGEFYRNTDDLNRVLDGLRKAGLAEQ